MSQDSILSMIGLAKRAGKVVSGESSTEKAVKENNGYCPCELIKNDDTKCPCKIFREQNTDGECHCGRFLKVSE